MQNNILGCLMISRRRIIKISAKVATYGGLASVFSNVPILAKAGSYKEYKWRGIVLGAESVITLHHYDAGRANDLLSRAVLIIKKYEKIFSLYSEGSDINLLNEKGALASENAEFLDLIKKSLVISHQTGGAFDISVQPLWEALKQNFDSECHNFEKNMSAAKALIGYENILIKQNRISFRKADMAITLNGIAQGYITDKVAEFLKLNGIDNVLCDLGEIRAIGSQADGSAWNIAIEGYRDEAAQGKPKIVKIKNGAIATSAVLEEGIGQFHLINSAQNSLGNLKPLHKSVTVFAPSATIADGFSTAFMNMKKSDIAAVAILRGDLKIYCTDVKDQSSVIS
jgi:thiamine biosynthesis lipoprotein